MKRFLTLDMLRGQLLNYHLREKLSLNIFFAQRGWVQMDPIKSSERMHDLILWNRIQNYKPQDLDSYLYDSTPREIVEICCPNLVALSWNNKGLIDALHVIRRAGPTGYLSLSLEEEDVRTIILKAMSQKGYWKPSDTPQAELVESGWGTKRRLTTAVADKLWNRGEVHIHHRESFNKTYYLPHEHRNDHAVVEWDQSAIRLALLTLRTQTYGIIPLTRSDQILIEERGYSEMIAVKVETLGGAYLVSPELLSMPSTFQNQQITLLAPLDPIIYDRTLTEALFNLRYRWEVYTPVQKRIFGYYALPILSGDQIIGAIDVSCDKTTKILTVYEDNPLVLDQSTHDALQLLAEWSGMSTVQISKPRRGYSKQLSQ